MSPEPRHLAEVFEERVLAYSDLWYSHMGRIVTATGGTVIAFNIFNAIASGDASHLQNPAPAVALMATGRYMWRVPEKGFVQKDYFSSSIQYPY